MFSTCRYSIACGSRSADVQHGLAFTRDMLTAVAYGVKALRAVKRQTPRVFVDPLTFSQQKIFRITPMPLLLL